MAVEADLQEWAVLPIVPAPLSDKDWDEIVSLSGLPPEARPLVARAIAMYRVADCARLRARTPAATRTLLMGASKLASALGGDIAQILRNPRAIVSLTATLDPKMDFATAMNGGLSANRMSNAVHELNRLAKWLSAAGAKVGSGRPGSREKALQVQILVQVVDKILQHFRGTGITRSNNRGNRSRELILKICRLADPKTERFAIEDAMKRQIRSRGRIRSPLPT